MLLKKNKLDMWLTVALIFTVALVCAWAMTSSRSQYTNINNPSSIHERNLPSTFKNSRENGNSVERNHPEKDGNRQGNKLSCTFQQGGFGLGDNVLGLLSLYYLKQRVQAIQARQLQFYFHWDLYAFLQTPKNTHLLYEKPPGQTISLTHELHPHFSYQLLEHVFQHQLKNETFWKRQKDSLLLECNMPLFIFDDLNDEALTRLCAQMIQDWLQPKPQLRSMIERVVQNTDVLYHVRSGDKTLVQGLPLDADRIQTLMEGVKTAQIPPRARIYLATDAPACIDLVRETYPQYQWKIWADYYPAVKLQHLVEVDKTQEHMVLQQTLAEFFMFQFVPVVFTQRWSNFSKIGLLANEQPQLQIWLYDLKHLKYYLVPNKLDLVRKANH